MLGAQAMGEFWLLTDNEESVRLFFGNQQTLIDY